MLPCQNSETQIFCLDFRWPGILGVRISEAQMFFTQFTITNILGVRISETQVFSTKISIFCDTLAIIYCQDFWVSEFRKPKCVFATFCYSYFGSPNFGNPNFRPNPLVMLCCYYHIPHKMRQTIAIRISSTVSRNFGRIVRKSKKFHTNDPNVVKTCRN